MSPYRSSPSGSASLRRAGVRVGAIFVAPLAAAWFSFLFGCVSSVLAPRLFAFATVAIVVAPVDTTWPWHLPSVALALAAVRTEGTTAKLLAAAAGWCWAVLGWWCAIGAFIV